MPELMRFNRGTSEYMVIEVTESLGEITTLQQATFDIFHSNDDDVNEPVISDSSDIIIDGMRVRCLIQPMEDWVPGYYDLYLNLLNLPTQEVPRLGPIEFVVEA